MEPIWASRDFKFGSDPDLHSFSNIESGVYQLMLIRPTSYIEIAVVTGCLSSVLTLSMVLNRSAKMAVFLISIQQAVDLTMEDI